LRGLLGGGLRFRGLLRPGLRRNGLLVDISERASGPSMAMTCADIGTGTMDMWISYLESRKQR
jgi:hypothetical protein